MDVCPTTVTGSAFQGWSVNVSGRGMSVRATHLPEIDAPVVLRFQEHGDEVIAEAVVVWRKKADEKSEFGVRFTALDSRSVQTLKALCLAEELPLPEADSLPEDEEQDTEPAPPAATAAVKLHIEGLAAPMQARVRQQGSRQVALASPLEFLRVGRDVDIEEASLGGRRKARIDRVDVDVDPDSHVPELVVSLRYDATAKPPRVRTPSTPAAKAKDFEADIPIDHDDESSDVALGRDEQESPALKATVRSVGAALPPASERDELDADEENEDLGVLHAGPSLEIEEESESEGPSDAERLRQRLDGMLDGLSKAARVARQRAEHMGAAASRGARWIAAHADSARRGALAAQRALPRRKTTSAPRSLRAGAPRSQSPKPSEATLRRLPPRRALAAGAIVLTAVAATWIGRASTRSDAAAQAVIPAAAAAPAVQAPAPTIIEETPPPPSQRPRVLVPPDDGEPEDVAEPAGVVAQVPLFGPTSLDPAARATARPRS
ncbi:MAG TPA: PilZ domain-containing protein, partial [Polyangiaceae bacterium]|nr:PilZ domain-containing protein [Polyangiaceae bacterium]